MARRAPIGSLPLNYARLSFELITLIYMDSILSQADVRTGTAQITAGPKAEC